MFLTVSFYIVALFTIFGAVHYRLNDLPPNYFLVLGGTVGMLLFVRDAIHYFIIKKDRKKKY